MPLIHMSCVWWSAPWTTVSSLSSSSVSPLSSSACSSTCTTCGGGGGGVNTGWGGRLGGLALWLYTRIRQPVFEAPRQGVPLAFPTVSLITRRHSWARPETGGRLRNYVCSSSRAGKGMGGAAVRARSRPTHLVPDVKGEGGYLAHLLLVLPTSIVQRVAIVVLVLYSGAGVDQHAHDGDVTQVRGRSERSRIVRPGSKTKRGKGEGVRGWRCQETMSHLCRQLVGQCRCEWMC